MNWSLNNKLCDLSNKNVEYEMSDLDTIDIHNKNFNMKLLVKGALSTHGLSKGSICNA